MHCDHIVGSGLGRREYFDDGDQERQWEVLHRQRQQEMVFSDLPSLFSALCSPFSSSSSAYLPTTTQDNQRHLAPLRQHGRAASDTGANGLSMLVVPLINHPGVSMRRLKVAGEISAGTTFIELDDVHVPVENLIDIENMSMKYIMTEFNHERLNICVMVTRQTRVALGAAFEYVMKREAFDKTLMNQPVVRHWLIKIETLLESQSAWIEQLGYQMTRLSKEEADVGLGGLTALCKAQAGVVLDECARCAVLLFGGNGFTRTGQGEIAERTYLRQILSAGIAVTDVDGRHLPRSSWGEDTWRVGRRAAGPHCEAVG